MPGAVGAITAARRRNRGASAGSRMPAKSKYSDANSQRMKAVWADQVKTYESRRLFAEYDTNHSGKLEKDQIVRFLSALDSPSAAASHPPTDEEVDYILRVADQSGDDALEFDELDAAVQAWNVYIKMQQELKGKLKEFDTSQTGALSKDELAAYLKSLNGGVEVSPEEVEWVMNEADILKDGEISNETELLMATSRWYINVEEKQKETPCCAMS